MSGLAAVPAVDRPSNGATRPLPHNDESERALLGAVMIARAALDDAVQAGVTADDFYQPSHGNIWRAAVDLASDGQPVDPVTVADQLAHRGQLEAAGGQPRLVELMAAAGPTGNASGWARILKDHARRRQLIAAGQELLEAGYNPAADTGPAILWARDRLDVVSVDGDPVDGSWQAIDLGPAWRGEKERPVCEVFPRDDGVGLLPAGLNGIHGDSGDGKSLTVEIAALLETRAGRPVIWVSYEDSNEDLVVDRFRLLGADDDDVDLLRFIIPQEELTRGTDYLADLASSVGCKLLVLDSVGEAMAVGGVNEDKDNEVGPWIRGTLRTIADKVPDLAIVMIDHSTKSKDNPLFPSGSKRKRAAISGRSYLLNVRTPFAQGKVGYVQLVVAKDRQGVFQRGEIAAEVKLDARTEPYQWDITAGREGDRFEPKKARRNSQERVRDVLRGSAVPLTAGEVHRMANDTHHRQPGEAELALNTVKNTLTQLAAAEGVAKVTDPSQHTGRSDDPSQHSKRATPDRWSLTRPNTETESDT